MDSKQLVAALNQDLAAELAAIIQYIVYAAKANGPHRPQLEQFFLEEADDERQHASYLANKIIALGGEPVLEADPVAKVNNNREALEAILEAERRALSGYTERVKQAEAAGQKALMVQLEDMIRDEQGHAEEVERILAGWSDEAA